MPIASVFRPALLVFGLAFAALFSPAVLGQEPVSTVADGFDPNVNGNVYAVTVLRDGSGKVLIAGKFETIQPPNAVQPIPRNNIARLLPDGRNDATFNANVDGQITTMVVQPNGQIVIGGKFSKVNGADRRRVARLNADGSLDPSFDPNIEPRDYHENRDASLTPEVTSLALQADGKIIVGGGFKFVHPSGDTETRRNRIARFNADGSLDHSFSPSFNNMVLSLAVQTDGKILVGGGFTVPASPGPIDYVPRTRIARLNADGTVDAGFDPKADNAVSAIAILPDARIYIAGSFTTLQPNGAEAPTAAAYVARLNVAGTIDTGFSSLVGAPVVAMALQPDGGILVGGTFQVFGRANVGRLFPSGGWDRSFLAGPNSTVRAIAVQPDGAVILGGLFTAVTGNGVASLPRNHVARVSFRGGLDTDFQPEVNGRLRSLMQLPDGKLLVGGSFTSIGGQTRTGIGRLNANGTLDAGFQADANGAVLAAVQLSNGQIIVAGAFSSINRVNRRYLAKLNPDGSVDPNFDPSPSAVVNAMVLQPDGKLLIAGAFISLSPSGATEAVSRNSLARLNPDGSVDTSYTAQTDEAVLTMVAQPDNKIVIGGAFTQVLPGGATNAVRRLAIARLNADGTLDSGFDPSVNNGTVHTIAVQTDGKVVFGGSFRFLAPNGATTATARNNLARVEASGALDTSFDPNVNGVVNAILLQSDKIVIGGRFSTLQPAGASAAIERNYVARINANGSLDDSFNLYLDTLPGNQVVSMALTSDSKVIVAGAFTRIGANSVPRQRIARVNSDGSVDTAFNSDVSTMGNADIRTLTQQFNGEVLVGGDFEGMGGTASANMARFYSDSSPDASFVPSLNGPVYSVAETPQKGGAVATQRDGFAWLGSDGQLRPGFAFSPALGTLTAINEVLVQPDEKILVAGSAEVSGSTSSLVRFNKDGSLDNGFQRVTTGVIYAVQPLDDGKFLIGGSFTTVGAVTRNNIARLNADGTLDPSFEVYANNTVAAIAIQPDGKIVLGGDFTSITGQGSTTLTSRGYIARLNADGTIDTGFHPNADNAVEFILLRAEGKILIGGAFENFKPNGVTTAVPRSRIALLNSDGTVDPAVDLKVNGTVLTSAYQSDGKLILGGVFTSIGGVTHYYLARLNADLSLDASFNSNANNAVQVVEVQPDDKILLGGGFTALQSGGGAYDPAIATPRNRLARLNSDGTVDPLFNPNFNGQVNTVTVYPGGSLIAAGSFTTIQPYGSMLVGGQFSSINGVSIDNLANFGIDGSVSATFRPNPNGAVYALLPIADGRSVVAGAFTQIADAPRNRIARFTAQDTLDTTFDPNANGDVFALALQRDGMLVVGGSFTSIAGAARNYLARLKTDGTIDPTFVATIPGKVTGIAVQPNGRVLVMAASGLQNVLLRLTETGAADPGFAPVTADVINTFALQNDGRIVVGGAFTAIAGAARSNLVRLNANGTLDSSFTSTPNGEVTAVSIQGDGKILFGGRFTSVDGLQRFGLARVATSTSSMSASAFTTNDSRTSVTWVRTGAGPEISSTYFEHSADLVTWTLLGQASRLPNTTNWQVAGVTLPADPVYIRARAIVPSQPNSSSGLIEVQARLSGALPDITSATAVSARAGSPYIYAISASGTPTNYGASGLPPGLNINAATGLITGTPTQPGTYQVSLSATNAAGTTTMIVTMIVGAPASKVEGSAVDAGANIHHPNGNTIDQFLLTGTSASLTADAGEVTRISYVDLDDDIVQVEFSGAGKLTVSLSGSSGPAAPVNYIQPGVTYMRGHAAISIVDADETTNLSVFSVGRANAVDQGLFRSDVNYDGIADIASISIASATGRFGGLRCGNTVFFADTGNTGLNAPAIQFVGPVYVGDIDAFADASPVLVLGSALADTLVTGGNLQQTNGKSVAVSGITQLRFVAGVTSHGVALPAQSNQAVLKQNGTDITSQIVVNP